MLFCVSMETYIFGVAENLILGIYTCSQYKNTTVLISFFPFYSGTYKQVNMIYIFYIFIAFLGSENS